MYEEWIREIVEKHQEKPGALLAILFELHSTFGPLTTRTLQVVSNLTGRTLEDLRGIASFYPALAPAGKAPPPRSECTEGQGVSQLRCHHCNHDLIDRTRRLDGLSPVRITVSFGFEHGHMLISSRYDSDAFQAEHELPRRGTVNFFCPWCHAEVLPAGRCPRCGAPMIPSVRPGGLMAVCSARCAVRPQVEPNETSVS